MAELLYVTGNPIKFRQAVAVCEPAGISLKQAQLDIIEIQSEDGEPIARDKASKAFAALQQPVVVSDDTWIIPGLGGFPGPYNSSINKWFSVDDWWRLTKDLTDRRIILRQFVVYQDAAQQKVFVADIEGALLNEPRGDSPYPHTALISFDGGRHSNAEINAVGKSGMTHLHNPWRDFAAWHATEIAK
jgi:inosine/xanthosine triphosphate pyrophosphatase family protein